MASRSPALALPLALAAGLVLALDAGCAADAGDALKRPYDASALDAPLAAVGPGFDAEPAPPDEGIDLGSPSAPETAADA
ncbi:MAG TPA: hypothetical protein VKU41_07935, partial [Polyangiaceae bacterium]|nr:hypothetical protein [Polyangiaceae bacterium]